MVEETSAAARNLNTEVTSLPGQTAMFKTENAAHRVAVSKTVVALSTLVKKHQEPRSSEVSELIENYDSAYPTSTTISRPR